MPLFIACCFHYHDHDHDHLAFWSQISKGNRSASLVSGEAQGAVVAAGLAAVAMPEPSLAARVEEEDEALLWVCFFSSVHNAGL